ncbi:hypothetical protein BZG02_04055 [Labilibaculum filiforme]|uniref:Uncharacterized protein n=1 Tax=Labilibaculum filiforme TaxID=1940526 RepID=A0A2N3I3Y8_9BACT|nr:DUF2764 family protein [Labilibaculum filiforme]PKQ65019.1 hypothetical protein BZG02_04055 [Labilibaculum filiforme]
MSNLVYLMSSLPSLTFGEVPPISILEFNQDAKNQLSTSQFNNLELIDIQGVSGETSKVGVKSIVAMLKGVQDDICEIRKARTQDRMPKLERLSAKEIQGTPLERERKIMQYQWEELESIEVGKTFTLIEVMVYKLKLQILSRLYSFNTEKGAQVLASVVNPSKKEED